MCAPFVSGARAIITSECSGNPGPCPRSPPYHSTPHTTTPPCHVATTPPDNLASTPRRHHTTIPHCHQPTPCHLLCSQSPVNQAARRPNEVMMSVAQAVLQSVREAAGLTCNSCRQNKILDAVLSRALASAQELINHIEHGA